MVTASSRRIGQGAKGPRGSSASCQPAEPADRSGLHSQPTRPADVIGPSSEGAAEGTSAPVSASSSEAAPATAKRPQIKRRASSAAARTGRTRVLDTYSHHSRKSKESVNRPLMCATALLITTLVAAPARAQAPLVVGAVRDQRGVPVDGAAVVGRRGNQAPLRTTTDRLGTFALAASGVISVLSYLSLLRPGGRFGTRRRAGRRDRRSL